MSSARERILAVVWARLRSSGGSLPTMSQAARACGISRQALYLHFATRTALLVALVDYVDRQESLAEGIAAVEAAPDGPGKVRLWAQMQADRNPRIAVLGRALDAARADDDAAQAAWADRTANRLRGATAIVAVLRRDGLLADGWTVEEAATLLAEILSFRVWDDLVRGATLPPKRYVEVVTVTALAALAAPLEKPSRSNRRRL